MSNFNKSIGKQLRDKRKEKRISAQAMADLINCSKSTYTYYERGITGIYIDDLIKVCDYLGLNWVEVAYKARESENEV